MTREEKEEMELECYAFTERVEKYFARTGWEVTVENYRRITAVLFEEDRIQYLCKIRERKS